MFKIFKKYIFLALLINTFELKVYARETNITSTTGSQTVKDIYLSDGNLDTTNSTWLNVTENGFINGTVTNSDTNNPGHVDIRNDYNTVKGSNSTTFGSSSSNLEYILVAGSSSSLTISNQIYVNNIYLENSTLQLNQNVNISDISIHNGNLDKKGTSTIIINTNYNQNTTFGYYQQDLVKNVSIYKIEITDGNSLTLNNYAYVDNMVLDSDSSTVTLNDNGKIIGNVIGETSGSGTVVINTNYNQEYTKFGTESNKLGTIQINNNKNLTIKATNAYENNVYANSLKLNGTGSSLTIGDNGKIFGTISGTGKVIIDTEYSGSVDTIFGTSSNKISSMEITSGNSINLTNGAYIDKTNLLGDSSLELNSGGSVTGSIYGTGSVNINMDYATASSTGSGSYATKFGNSASEKLSTLNIKNNTVLTLGNAAYVDSLNLNTSSSKLAIGSGGTINGTVNDLTNGSAVVDLNRNYDTAANSTIFGTAGNSIGTLNVGTLSSSRNLALGNLAYINNVALNANLSNVTLSNDGGLMGAFTGNGTIVINKNYTTTYGTADTANNEYNTEFGKSGSKINTVNVNAGMNLTLGTAAYLNSLNLNNNSILTLKDGSAISGTVYGTSTNSTVNVEGIFDGGSLGSGNKAYFGSSEKSISQVNIGSNGSFALTTDSYIDKINVTASASTRAPTLALKADNASLTLNNISNISYDDTNNIAVLITLKNTANDTNNEFMDQLYELLQLINNAGASKDFTVTNNNLYLDIMSKAQADGDRLLIDSSTNTDYFSEASLVYETIFKDLKLETAYNATTSATDLYLVVKMDRTPTINDVSQAAITSSNVIDSWKFIDRTINESILVSNLQNITNKQDFFHALRNLSPDVSGLNVKIPTQSIASAVGNIDKRLSYFRMMKFDSKTNNYNIKNLSKYDIKYYDDYFTKPYPENNVWMEAFAGNLHQDTVDNIFGYDANFYGATLGYDVRVNPEFVFGISYTFNQVNANDIDYVKSTRDDLKAMTNNVDLYFMFYNRWNYLTLNVGGSYNKYNQERKIKFYNFDKTAKADYNGYSYYGGVEYGFNILLFNNNKTLEKDKKKIKTKKNEKFKPVNKDLDSYIIGPINNFIMLTPKISLTYNNIMIDDYTEKGADAANLIIKTKDYSSLDVNGGLALTLSRSLSKNTTFQTALNGFVSYAIVNNKVELDARYVDDDEVFKVYGIDPPDLTYNLGISFSFNFFDKMDLGLSYNYMFGDGFNGMIGRITFLWAF